MTRLLVAGALILCASIACANNMTSPAPLPARVEWVQVWSDEFEGPAGAGVDNTKWRHDLADGCPVGICGWGNSEKEYYTSTPENIALTGQGQLAIVARPAPAGLSCYYGPCRYTSAKITTRGLMSAAPGRVEARIRLPTGQGLWPAFWMLGDNASGWPDCGELDIMENKGSQPATTSSAMHGPGYAGAASFNQAHTLSGSRVDDFHTYAIEWDSVGARFFVDGTAHYSVTRATVERAGKFVFDQPFYVIFNLAVGGHFDGDPASDAILPATMLVDYVRVYRRLAPKGSARPQVP